MSKLRTLGAILGGCLGVAVLLVAVLAGLFYYGFKSTDATISPKIDLIFATIENGTFTETYETETTQALRAATTREQYEAIGNSISFRLGKLRSKSLQSFKVQQHNAQTFLEVSYGAVFEKGPGTILAKFEKLEGSWKVLTFRVKSKLFDQAPLTRSCPECGAACTDDASFCPACGSKFEAEEESDQSEPADDDLAARVRSSKPQPRDSAAATHSGCSRYHQTVSRMPSLRSVCGDQPSSVLAFDESRA